MKMTAEYMVKFGFTMQVNTLSTATCFFGLRGFFCLF